MTTTEQLAQAAEQSVWPSVTVIIPVHGDHGEIVATAKALARQDYPGPWSVLVIDNGRNVDLPRSLAALPNASVLVQPLPGSYAARNLGVEQAGGEVLAFTDADCVPRSDWLRQGVTLLRAQPGPAFVGGAIEVFAARSDRPTWAEDYDCAVGLPQQRYVTRDGWAATANMITTRQSFDLVGPFQPDLRSGGDRQWGQRAAAAGLAAVYGPDVIIDHPARATIGELRSKLRRVVGGELDSRRIDGRPAFDAGTLWSQLRPNTRSALAISARITPHWSLRRVRFVILSHWLQYAYLWHKLCASRRPAS